MDCDRGRLHRRARRRRYPVETGGRANISEAPAETGAAAAKVLAAAMRLLSFRPLLAPHPQGGPRYLGVPLD